MCDSRNIKKSKLVQQCSVNNDDFGKFYDSFEYNSTSGSTQSQVNVKIPAYPSNLMFYEHFRLHTESSPFALCFLYVGGMEHEPFSSYTDVTLVEFFNRFDSVRSCFKIISELPNCEEVRFHLDSKNINLSAIEKEIGNDFTPFKCGNVKKIRINLKSGGTEKYIRTKLHAILEYACDAFPCLETAHITATHSSGFDYDIIKKFQEKNLPDHQVEMTGDGALTCKPRPASEKTNTKCSVGSFSRSTSYNLPNSASSNKVPDIGKSPPSIVDNTACKLNVKGEKGDTFCFNNGTASTKEEECNIKEEIIELPVEPRNPPFVDIASDDEFGNSPRKKIKHNIHDSGLLGSHPVNTLEISTFIDAKTKTELRNPVTKTEPARKQSSWESSDEETDSIRDRPTPIIRSNGRGTPPSYKYGFYNDDTNCIQSVTSYPTFPKTSFLHPTISAAVSNECIKEEDLKKALRLVSAAAATGEKTSNASKRKMVKLVEGVHFDRRPRT